MDKIIAESIKVELVGEQETLVEPPRIDVCDQPAEEDKSQPEKPVSTNQDAEIDNEPKSERSSSGSDQFVIVSGGGSGSETEVVDTQAETSEQVVEVVVEAKQDSLEHKENENQEAKNETNENNNNA